MTSIIDFIYSKKHKCLSNLNKYYNCRSLPQKTKLILGLFDAYIPFNTGLAMFKQVKKFNKNAKLIVYPCGHCFAMFIFGILNRLGLR